MQSIRYVAITASCLFLAARGACAFDPLLTKIAIHSAPPPSCTTPISHDAPLVLPDAIRHALCNNPQTHKSWANVLAQAGRLGSSRSAYLPTVNAGATAAYTRIHGGTLGSYTQKDITPAVTLDYLLFDFGGRSASVDVTKQELTAMDYTHYATLLIVMFAAIEAYYQLYASQGAVAAADETVTSTKTALDAASLRYQIGAVTVADKLQAETVHSQAMLQKTTALNQMNINHGILANTMGLDPHYEFKIAAQMRTQESDDFGGDVKTLLDEARKARPDLAASEAQVASAKANIAVQRANGLPNFTLDASRSYDDIRSGPIPSENDSIIGVTMHIPLFTGFNNTYQIKTAREQLEAQQAIHDETQNAVLLDVWRTYNNYLTAKQTLGMTETLLGSARESDKVALGRYKAGAGSLTDMLNAEAQLASARQQYVQAQYDWLVSRADLLRAIGKLDEKTLAADASASPALPPPAPAAATPAPSPPKKPAPTAQQPKPIAKAKPKSPFVNPG